MAVQVPCSQCEKILIRYPGALKSQKFGPFCDRHCLGKFRTAKLHGEWAANYKQGFRRDREYISVRAEWHPHRDDKCYVSLHRLIAEARLGRFLKEGEIIHHKDHNPQNNHWDNLEVTNHSEHAKHHFSKENRKRKQ